MSGTGKGRFNETKLKVPDIGLDLNKPAETFTFVMALCAIIFVFAVFFFSYMRLRFRQIYSPRFLLIENKTFGGTTSQRRGFFSWVQLPFTTCDEDIYTFSGFDALVFLRFLRLLLKFALCTMPYGLIVLLPININGHNNLKDGLDKISMSNVEAKSSHLWAHWVAVWVYSLLVFFLTYKEWKVFISYRQRYLKRGSGEQFVVLVRELPDEITDDNLLFDYVDRLFPGMISSVYLVKDLSEWDKYIKEHNEYVIKWEHVKYLFQQNGKRKDIHTGRCYGGEKVDAMTHYEEKLEEIQEKLLNYRNRREKIPLNCAFIFFKSLKSRTIALQSVWTNNPLKILVSPAPKASDINWGALKIKFTLGKVLEALGFVVVFFLVIFWAVPITFISSLTNIESLAKTLTFLKPIVNSSELLVKFMQGVLPVILIAVFYLLLPYLLFWIAKLQGNFSGSCCAEMVFKCLFVFQTFNTFFIYIMSGAVLQNIALILDRPFDIPNVLARSLPSQSGFFVNYLAIASFVGLAIEITRIWPLIYISIRLKWIDKTDRERLDAWKPKRPEYEVMFSQALLFFLIGISYSILSPIIVPFVVLYYAFGYVVWLYQLLHVYIATFDHGGRFWPYVFNRMMIAVLVFQLLMIGVFLLKEIWIAAVCLAPLPVICVMFWVFVTKTYSAYSEFLVAEERVGTKHAETHFLEEVRKWYIRDSQLPEVFEPHITREMNSDEYIPINSLNDIDEDLDLETREDTRLLGR